ncbi:hypothetical protein Poli38472_002903 [Pythium oligandrum]|uniref:EF-hand domain-containing protein n=1 Tax=Pythium oligandrum TaxID=41045 RepID=A0A8K1C636_PYTOL|nr:hypothetical protein Poli38472_002903 [Pythium oligandrum]|eukprot:TMW56978.1 hypothetical protein Poli38472_002903 [Pythium oligandrum]
MASRYARDEACSLRAEAEKAQQPAKTWRRSVLTGGLMTVGVLGAVVFVNGASRSIASLLLEAQVTTLTSQMAFPALDTNYDGVLQPEELKASVKQHYATKRDHLAHETSLTNATRSQKQGELNDEETTTLTCWTESLSNVEKAFGPVTDKAFSLLVGTLNKSCPEVKVSATPLADEEGGGPAELAALLLKAFGLSPDGEPTGGGQNPDSSLNPNPSVVTDVGSAARKDPLADAPCPDSPVNGIGEVGQASNPKPGPPSAEGDLSIGGFDDIKAMLMKALGLEGVNGASPDDEEDDPAEKDWNWLKPEDNTYAQLTSAGQDSVSVPTVYQYLLEKRKHHANDDLVPFVRAEIKYNATLTCFSTGIERVQKFQLAHQEYDDLVQWMSTKCLGDDLDREKKDDDDRHFLLPKEVVKANLLSHFPSILASYTGIHSSEPDFHAKMTKFQSQLQDCVSEVVIMDEDQASRQIQAQRYLLSLMWIVNDCIHAH